MSEHLADVIFGTYVEFDKKSVADKAAHMRNLPVFSGELLQLKTGSANQNTRNMHFVLCAHRGAVLYECSGFVVKQYFDAQAQQYAPRFCSRQLLCGFIVVPVL